MDVQHTYIRNFSSHTADTVTVKGWVSNIRFSKTNIFIDFRDGSGFCQVVMSQDVLGEERFEEAKKLTRESSLAVSGTLIADERQLGGYEIQANSFCVYHIAVDFPIKANETEHGVRFLEDNRHIWLRSRRQWAIMRVRNQVIMGIHAYFQDNGFVQMDSPLFTGNAAEGSTTLFETDFFGEPAYLAQTGQLYGEAMAMAQGLIYTFGPTFRAEKSNTPRHLAEFWMIEPEMAFFDNDMNMSVIEGMVRSVVSRVLEKCETELKMLDRDTSKLQFAAEPFPRIKYVDAVKILRGELEINGKNAIALQEEDLAHAKALIEQHTAEIAEREATIKGGVKKGIRKFNEQKIAALQAEIKELEEQVRNIPNWIESAKNFVDGEDFGGSDETVLTRVFDAPVMVHDWPAKIKAFYMKEVDGNPDYVKGVDLLAPEGFGEVVGGSERETDIDVLVKKIEEHKLPQDVFEWYLDLRRFGSVPHSGFGLGLERLVRWICNLNHMRETIPFARRYGRLNP